MKKVRSYKRVWNFERVLHSIHDWHLPRAFTFTQIGWFMGAFGVMFFLGNSFLLSWLDNAIIKYFGIPIGLAWFMSQKTFDGKRPHKFVYSVVIYHLNRKVRFAGKPVTFKKRELDITYTTVERRIIGD